MKIEVDSNMFSEEWILNPLKSRGRISRPISASHHLLVDKWKKMKEEEGEGKLMVARLESGKTLKGSLVRRSNQYNHHSHHRPREENHQVFHPNHTHTDSSCSHPHPYPPSHHSSDNHLYTSHHTLTTRRSRLRSLHHRFSPTSLFAAKSKIRPSFLLILILFAFGSGSVKSEKNFVFIPEYRTGVACEGGHLELNCEEGTHIDLIRANFGRFSISVCNEEGHQEWSVDCMSPRSFRVVQESCAGVKSCQLSATRSKFGDPCPGTYKYLEIQYQCLADGPKRASSHGNSSAPKVVKTASNAIVTTATAAASASTGTTTRRTTTATPIVHSESSISFTTPNTSWTSSISSSGNEARNEGGPTTSRKDSTLSKLANTDDRDLASSVSQFDSNYNFKSNPSSMSDDEKRSDMGALASGHLEGHYARSDSDRSLGLSVGGGGGVGSTNIRKEKTTGEIFVKHPHPRFGGKPSESTTATTLSLPTEKIHNRIQRPSSSSSSSFSWSSSGAPSPSSYNNHHQEPSEGNLDPLNTNALPPTTGVPVDYGNYCPPVDSRNLSWTWTPLLQFAIQPCPTGSRGYARWLCANHTGLPSWFPTVPDLSDCSSHWVIKLEENINQAQISIVTLAKELARSTQTKTVYGSDLFKIADIVNGFVFRLEAGLEEFAENKQRNEFVKKVLNAIVESVSNLFRDFQKSSWMDLGPEERKDAVTHLISAIERTSLLFSETKSVYSDYVRQEENLYIGIHIRPMNLVSSGGIRLPVDDGSLLDTEEGNRDEEIDEDPESFHLEEGHFSSNAVQIPLKTLRQFEKSGLVRISYIVYRKLNSLLKPSPASAGGAGAGALVKNQQQTQEYRLSPMDSFSYATTRPTESTAPSGGGFFINSDVITLITSKERHLQIPVVEKIRLTLRHLLVSSNLTNPICVSWNQSDMDWSRHGCNLISSNSSHTLCECSQLSNLAVLMEIKRNIAPLKSSSVDGQADEGEEEMVDRGKDDDGSKRWHVITLFGSSLSTLCIILTLIAFLTFKNLGDDRAKIKINLLLCLLIGELVFLFGVNQTTDSFLLRRGIQVLLHYALISAFLWLFLEGFTLYHLFVDLLKSSAGSTSLPTTVTTSTSNSSSSNNNTSRAFWYYLVSYGSPALLVLIQFYLNANLYESEKASWLGSDNYSLLMTLVVPLVATSVSTLILLTLTLFILPKHVSELSSSSSADSGSTLSSQTEKDQNRLKNLRLWLRESLALLLLMAFTWTVAILYLRQGTIGMANWFALLNAAQGFYIFITYSWSDAKIRKRYTKLVNIFQCKSNCFYKRRPVRDSSSLSGSKYLFAPVNVNISSAMSKTQQQQQKKKCKENNRCQSTTEQPIIGPSSICRLTTPSGAKYFITSGASTASNEPLTSQSTMVSSASENDYGFRSMSRKNNHKQDEQHQQQQHRSHQKSRICSGRVDNVLGTTRCGHHLQHELIEHVYECIDDDPYIAILFNPLMCHLGCNSTSTGNSSYQINDALIQDGLSGGGGCSGPESLTPSNASTIAMASATAGVVLASAAPGVPLSRLHCQNFHLPAIIRDNTMEPPSLDRFGPRK